MKAYIAQTTAPIAPQPQPPDIWTTGALVASVGSLIYQLGKNYIENLTKRSQVEIERERNEAMGTQAMVKGILDQQQAAFSALLQGQRQDREELTDTIRDNTLVIRQFVELNGKVDASQERILKMTEKVFDQNSKLGEALERSLFLLESLSSKVDATFDRTR
jgi:predicted nuclease with TOPRIM domain